MMLPSTAKFWKLKLIGPIAFCWRDRGALGLVVMAGIRANGPMGLAGGKRGEFQTDHYHSALGRLTSEQQIAIGQLTSGNALEHGYASKRADTFVGEIAPTNLDMS